MADMLGANQPPGMIPDHMLAGGTPAAPASDGAGSVLYADQIAASQAASGLSPEPASAPPQAPPQMQMAAPQVPPLGQIPPDAPNPQALEWALYEMQGKLQEQQQALAAYQTFEQQLAADPQLQQDLYNLLAHRGQAPQAPPPAEGAAQTPPGQPQAQGMPSREVLAALNMAQQSAQRTAALERAYAHDKLSQTYRDYDPRAVEAYAQRHRIGDLRTAYYALRGEWADRYGYTGPQQQAMPQQYAQYPQQAPPGYGYPPPTGYGYPPPQQMPPQYPQQMQGYPPQGYAQYPQQIPQQYAQEPQMLGQALAPTYPPNVVPMQAVMRPQHVEVPRGRVAGNGPAPQAAPVDGNDAVERMVADMQAAGFR